RQRPEILSIIQWLKRASAGARRASRTLFWPFLPIARGHREAWLLVAVAILALERPRRLAGLDHDPSELAAATALPREPRRRRHECRGCLVGSFSNGLPLRPTASSPAARSSALLSACARRLVMPAPSRVARPCWIASIGMRTIPLRTSAYCVLPRPV